MVHSLFSCHKCARWSHPILTFLTFHEIDFATNVHSVLFTRNIFGSWLYLLMPFYYRHGCIHICWVWYELFGKKMKYYTLFRVLRWEFASVYIQACTFQMYDFTLIQYIITLYSTNTFYIHTQIQKKSIYSMLLQRAYVYIYNLSNWDSTYIYNQFNSDTNQNVLYIAQNTASSIA